MGRGDGNNQSIQAPPSLPSGRIIKDLDGVEVEDPIVGPELLKEMKFGNKVTTLHFVKKYVAGKAGFPLTAEVQLIYTNSGGRRDELCLVAFTSESRAAGLEGVVYYRGRNVSSLAEEANTLVKHFLDLGYSLCENLHETFEPSVLIQKIAQIKRDRDALCDAGFVAHGEFL